MSLEPATEADIPAIMAIERIPDYALFIGSFSEDEHRGYMASPDARYLVWREGGEAVAFVILFNLTDENRAVLAKRIGAAMTDTGLGRRFIPAMIDWVFENTQANRFELDCSMENPRALRVYEREGFVREGVVREVYRADDGRYISSALFSMLRREWEALRGRT